MKFNCNVVDDLLPLYLENLCSEDSKAALEAHLKSCPDCREKLSRMKNADIVPKPTAQKSELPIADYAKKVRRHRIRVAVVVVIIGIIAACLAALISLTLSDMHRQANPTVFDIEPGVYNLTASELEITAEKVGEYVLFTNSTRIRVCVSEGSNFEGEIILWSVTDKQNPREIGYARLDSDNNACAFTNLSAAQRYMVTFDGDKSAVITVSDGRIVSFWYSLVNVLAELFG